MDVRRIILTILTYLLFVAGIVIFLILLEPPIDPPQQVEQPQPVEERIAPAEPLPDANKNKRQPRRVRSPKPKEKAQIYEADGNSGQY